MLKNRSAWAAIAVIIVAIFLRFFQLGSVPHGMTWDEAAIGYNGHAIRVARRDEWLIKLPLTFKSFGDYKSPLAIYINGAFTGLLGMKLWVVRLPFALSSIGAIVLFMMVLRRLLEWTSSSVSQLSLNLLPWFVVLGGFMLTTTPWHIHFSRVGFESGMALAFLISSLWLIAESWEWPLEKSWKKIPGLLFKVGLSFGAALFLGASMYTYHSAKVVSPLVAIMFILMWLPHIKKNWVALLTLIVAASAITRPLILDSFGGESGERFNQATLFNKGLSTSDLLSTLTHQFLIHLHPNFLIFGQTPTLRHGDGVWGVMLITTFFLVLVGLVACINQWLKVIQDKAKWDILKLPLFAGVWIFIGTLPAAIGVDVPHSNRALLALPGYILLAVWGMIWLVEVIRSSSFNRSQQGTKGEKQTILKIFVGMWVLFQSLLGIKYLQHYYTAFAADSASEFKDGYLEAFEYVIPYEKGRNGVEPVSQIIFTSDYGQPYIYALFARKTDPIYYQGGSLNKYLFLDTITEADLDRRDVIIVASAEDDIPEAKANKLVFGSDGHLKFKIYHTAK